MARWERSRLLFLLYLSLSPPRPVRVVILPADIYGESARATSLETLVVPAAGLSAINPRESSPPLPLGLPVLATAASAASRCNLISAPGHGKVRNNIRHLLLIVRRVDPPNFRDRASEINPPSPPLARDTHRLLEKKVRLAPDSLVVARVVSLPATDETSRGRGIARHARARFWFFFFSSSFPLIVAATCFLDAAAAQAGQ